MINDTPPEYKCGGPFLPKFYAGAAAGGGGVDFRGRFLYNGEDGLSRSTFPRGCP